MIGLSCHGYAGIGEFVGLKGTMQRKQLETFKKRLLQKRGDSVPDPLRAQGAATGSSEYGRDEGDRANASLAKEMAFLRTLQVRGLRELIDAALSRIREGTFGECLNCAQEIGSRRLDAIQWTPYCITCQELVEGK